MRILSDFSHLASTKAVSIRAKMHLEVAAVRLLALLVNAAVVLYLIYLVRQKEE